jgi:hypothetical protein
MGIMIDAWYWGSGAVKVGGAGDGSGVDPGLLRSRRFASRSFISCSR